MANVAYLKRLRRRTSLKAKAFNTIVREAVKKVGLYWWINYLPQHFKPGARFRYGYPARTAKYLQKRRKYAQRRGEPDADLVYTGRARAMALSSTREPTATATANRIGMNVRIRVPAYMKRYASQLTATTRAERRRMSKLLKALIIQAINSGRHGQTETIRMAA